MLCVYAHLIGFFGWLNLCDHLLDRVPTCVAMGLGTSSKVVPSTLQLWKGVSTTGPPVSADNAASASASGVACAFASPIANVCLFFTKIFTSSVSASVSFVARFRVCTTPSKTRRRGGSVVVSHACEARGSSSSKSSSPSSKLSPNSPSAGANMRLYLGLCRSAI